MTERHQRDRVPSRFQIAPLSPDPCGGYEVLIDGIKVPWAIGCFGAEAPIITQTEVPELKFVTLTFMVDGVVDIDPHLVTTHLGEGQTRVERPGQGTIP